MIKKLLVTSTGGTVGELIIDMIREALPLEVEIIASDASVDVSYLDAISKAVLLPKADHDIYCESLIKLISEEQIDAVLPLSEEECMLIAELDETGRLGARYLGMPSKTLNIIMNKVLCAKVLNDAGIDVPRSLPLNKIENIEETFAELGYPNKPVVIKPVSARGSRGFRVVKEKINKLEELARKGGPIFMDCSQIKDVFSESQSELSDYFAMEFLPGGSVSVDLVAWEGKALAIFPHFRMGYEWGFVDHARIERNVEIENYCRNVIALLNMQGMCNIELGYREDGSLSLIEVNGRTSATSAQNSLLGINCFDILMRAYGGKPQTFEFDNAVEYRTLTKYTELHSCR